MKFQSLDFINNVSAMPHGAFKHCLIQAAVSPKKPGVEFNCWFVDSMFLDVTVHLYTCNTDCEAMKTIKLQLIFFRNPAKRVLNNDSAQNWIENKSLSKKRIEELNFYWSSNLLKFQFTMIDRSNIYSNDKDDNPMNMACYGLLK